MFFFAFLEKAMVNRHLTYDKILEHLRENRNENENEVRNLNQIVDKDPGSGKSFKRVHFKLQGYENWF